MRFNASRNIHCLYIITFFIFLLEKRTLKQIILQCFVALVVEGSIPSIVLQYAIT